MHSKQPNKLDEQRNNNKITPEQHTIKRLQLEEMSKELKTATQTIIEELQHYEKVNERYHKYEKKET